MSSSFPAMAFGEGAVTPDELIRQTVELMYAMKKGGEDALASATFTG